MNDTMPSRRLIGLVCAFTAGFLPGAGGAWTAGNSQHVNPISPTTFEVVGRSGSSNVDYWCAAGDYARRVLGLPLAQRIYVSRGRAAAETENRKSAVQFSTDPPTGADTRPGWLLSVTRVGENLSASGAWQYCLDHKQSEE